MCDTPDVGAGDHRREKQCRICRYIDGLRARLVGDLERDHEVLEAILVAAASLPYPEQACPSGEA